MTWNKRQKATELRKRLETEEFFTRDISTNVRGPVMLKVTRLGSTLPPVSVWTELAKYTIHDRNGYDEYWITSLDEIITRLKGLDW